MKYPLIGMTTCSLFMTSEIVFGDLPMHSLAGNGLYPHLDMVHIPADSFLLGDESGDGDSDEHNPVSVWIPSFFLSRYEVTFHMWDICYEEGGCSRNPDDEGWGRGSNPVINISWPDAQEFIDWLNQKTGGDYRLPSEAEWEYAAKAGTSTSRYWGNEVGDGLANCSNCESKDSERDRARGWTNKQVSPVGSYTENPLGLHDMMGNVWEYTQDCWRSGGYREDTPVDGSALLFANCDRRVIKGGAWFTSDQVTRSSAKNAVYASKNYRTSYYGFRLAHDFVDSKDNEVATSIEEELENFKLILFALNSEEISADQYYKLQKVADYLRANSHVALIITGHTDASHTVSYNELLSLRRAVVVEKWFIKQGLKRQIAIVNYRGEEQPLKTNETWQGRALNRRVQLSLRSFTNALMGKENR